MHLFDVLDLKGKQFIFIDEISFGFPLDLEGDKNKQRRKRSFENNAQLPYSRDR